MFVVCRVSVSVNGCGSVRVTCWVLGDSVLGVRCCVMCVSAQCQC